MNVLDSTNEDIRLLYQEWNILQFCAHFEQLMEQKNITRTELAKRLGTDKSYVTKLLAGANLTIKKVTDVLLALDSSLSINTILGLELITNIKAISDMTTGIENMIEQKKEEYSQITKETIKETKKDSFKKYPQLIAA